jgi:hypothetical protein
MTTRLDWTFSTKEMHDGKKVKGTYFRRINDIQLALDKFGCDQLTVPAKFVACYWGCEKLGKAIVGAGSGIADGGQPISLWTKIPSPFLAPPNMIASVRRRVGLQICSDARSLLQEG